jgi:DNA-binding MarR family transcriptional regulator
MHRLLHVLADAGERGEQLGVGDVAEAIGVDQPRSSRLVTTGVERGYVIRETDARDARRSVIRITAEGGRHLGHVRARRRAAVEQALADFSDEEAATLARLLDRFAEAWSRSGEPPGLSR